MNIVWQELARVTKAPAVRDGLISRRPGRWIAAFLCAALSGGEAVAGGTSTKIPVDPAVEEAFLATAGEGFRLRRTAHFLIAYDTDSETLRDFIARVEATYRAANGFLRLHDVPQAQLEQRLQIYFFAHHEDFHAYAARIGADVRGAAGFYNPADNRAAFYDTLSTPRLAELNATIQNMEEKLRTTAGGSRNYGREALVKELRILRNQRNNMIETINQLVVQHEVAHQIFYNAGLHGRGADNPVWIVEGLGCLFETPPGPHGAGMAAVNQYRLLNLREALAGKGNALNATAEQFADACRDGRLVPLRRLVADQSLFDTTKANVENIYAQAWSLVYYLQRRRRDKLGEYLTVVATRPSDRAYGPEQELQQFEFVFGPLDEEFERQWLEYVLAQRVRGV